MAVPASPFWMRSDVTGEDPVRQRDTSGHVKYPPLRFYSRHSPPYPDDGPSMNGAASPEDEGHTKVSQHSSGAKSINKDCLDLGSADVGHRSASRDHVPDPASYCDTNGESLEVYSSDPSTWASPNYGEDSQAEYSIGGNWQKCWPYLATSGQAVDDTSSEDWLPAVGGCSESDVSDDKHATTLRPNDHQPVTAEALRQRWSAEAESSRTRCTLVPREERPLRLDLGRGGSADGKQQTSINTGHGPHTDSGQTLPHGGVPRLNRGLIVNDQRLSDHRELYAVQNTDQTPLGHHVAGLPTDSNIQTDTEQFTFGRGQMPYDTAAMFDDSRGPHQLDTESGRPALSSADTGRYHQVRENRLRQTGRPTIDDSQTALITRNQRRLAADHGADTLQSSNELTEEEVVTGRHPTPDKNSRTSPTDLELSTAACDGRGQLTRDEISYVINGPDSSGRHRDENELTMKSYELRDGGGSVPEVTIENNGRGMLGTRCAARQHDLLSDDDTEAADGSRTDSGAGGDNSGMDQQDEGIGDEDSSIRDGCAPDGCIQNSSPPRSVSAVQAENNSDNSSVDSEGLSYRKSALKNRTSGNRDGTKRSGRKVRFAEPLVIRETKTTSLSARERLGLSTDGSFPLGNGLILRPRIEYVDKPEPESAHGDGLRESAVGKQQPDGHRKPIRFIEKRGPPITPRMRRAEPEKQRVKDFIRSDPSGERSGSESDRSLDTSSSSQTSPLAKCIPSTGGASVALAHNSRSINSASDGVRNSPETSAQATPSQVSDSQASVSYGGKKPVSGTAVPFSRTSDKYSSDVDGQTFGIGSEQRPGYDAKSKPRVTLSRSAPVQKKRQKPSPETRRSADSLAMVNPSPEQSDPASSSPYHQIRREMPIRSWTDDPEIRYGLFMPNGEYPDRNSNGDVIVGDKVPVYMKFGQKVLPPPDVDHIRPARTNDPAARVSNPDRLASRSYEDVSRGSLYGVQGSPGHQHPGRFSSVPELAVIPLQTDSPSVPSPVSGDSGISSSSSVTDLNRDQTTCQSVADYNTAGGFNCIQNDKRSSAQSRVSVGKERGEAKKCRGAGGMLPDGSIHTRRLTEDDMRQGPPPNSAACLTSPGGVVRRTSGVGARRSQVTSAIEMSGNDGDLDQWSRVINRVTKDDASVEYLKTAHRQDNTRSRPSSNRQPHSPDRIQPPTATSGGYYPRHDTTQHNNANLVASGDRTPTDADDENPYGRFLRSATNRKSTRAKLIPIPMDILNPRGCSGSDSDVHSLSTLESWGAPYHDRCAADDSRRLSNSSGYSTQDPSYGRLPSAASMASGSDGLTPPGGRPFASSDKSEPKFSSTAEIYKLLREKSRNPFVKANGYT